MQNIQSTDLLFNMSKPGVRCARLPAQDTPDVPLEELIPVECLAESTPDLPALGELELVRHFTNLSAKNMSVDTHFYPLGSCTMKYNPKRNEALSSLPGLIDLHPYQPVETMQGQLFIFHELQKMLAEISGLDAVSLQPAAGAHGEFAAILIAAAYFRDKGEERTTVLVPDGAHGTNPASAAMAGFKTVEVKSTPKGLVDLEDLAAKTCDKTAVFMITNPNTLGLFDGQIAEIAAMIHEVGGLVYLDGANMNAILGVARPGDFGADMMHFNPHKTFSGPHGGGGPGAGPIAVRADLEPFLPSPMIVERTLTIEDEGKGEEIEAVWYEPDFDRPKSIGRVRTFFGNVGVLNRTYCYIMTHGPSGLRRVSENAVLNANYILSQVKDFLDVPNGDRCMHEFVASSSKLKSERGITAMDFAKRLIDYGYHAPTVYFPLIVPEALMIEPTETETKETLDAFAEVLRKIAQEDVEMLHEAPHTTEISRPDEVTAARQPVLCCSSLR